MKAVLATVRDQVSIRDGVSEDQVCSQRRIFVVILNVRIIVRDGMDSDFCEGCFSFP